MRAVWDALISWLNQNSGAAQAMLTAGLVLFAAWQGILAWSARRNAKRLAEAAKAQADASVKMAEALFRPVVDLDLPLARGPQGMQQSTYARNKMLLDHTECVISNLGVGPALDMEVSILHPSQRFNAVRVGALRPAASARIYFLKETGDREGKGDSARGSLVAIYAGVYGNKWKSQRKLDFDVGNSRAELGPLKVSRA